MTSRTRVDLAAASMAIIRGGQHASGAYVAAPRYPTYDYVWLRDGSFCAYAMDLHGQTGSAAAFHRFVGQTLLGHRTRAETAIRVALDGADPSRMLPTRFTLTGALESGVEAWPNFQLDGYGTWLWALRDHVSRGGRLDSDLTAAVALAADYLVATRRLPCYDCWEEYGDRRHVSTVAAVVAGLRAASELLDRPDLAALARETWIDLERTHLRNGAYVKHDATDGVDASLLWLAVPFGVVDPVAPEMTATAARIADELVGPTGGVRRYLGDEFYGGGEWILLTAWLGWYRATTGDLDGALAVRKWIEAAATSAGELPEQVTGAAQRPDRVEPWVERWGPVATPLLWSHAMYLVLDRALTTTGGGR